MSLINLLRGFEKEFLRLQKCSPARDFQRFHFRGQQGANDTMLCNPRPTFGAYLRSMTCHSFRLNNSDYIARFSSLTLAWNGAGVVMFPSLESSCVNKVHPQNTLQAFLCLMQYRAIPWLVSRRAWTCRSTCCCVTESGVPFGVIAIPWHLKHTFLESSLPTYVCCFFFLPKNCVGVV